MKKRIPFTFTEIAGHLYFAVLLVLALVFSRERILFADGAYYTFHMILHEGFVIIGAKFVNVLTQLMPLGMIKLSAPLGDVLASYSASFVLLHYMIFLACVRLLRDPLAGMLVLLASALGGRDPYFWPLAELQYGTAAMALFIPILIRAVQGSRRYAAAGFLFSAVLMYVHPLMIFSVLFFLGYGFLDDKKRRLRYLYGILSALALYGLRWLSLAGYYYETQKAGGAFKVLMKGPQALLNDTLLNFFDAAIPWYISLFLLFFLQAGYLIYRKDFILSVYYFLSPVGYLLMVCATHPPDVRPFYLQTMLLPLNLMIAAPLLYDVAAGAKWGKIRSWALGVICLAGIAGILQASGTYVKRLDDLRGLITCLEEKGHHKVITDDTRYYENRYIMSWAMPYEVLLYSSLLFPVSPVAFRSVDHLPDVGWAMDADDNFISAWEIYKYHRLDRRYFVLPHEPYVYIPGKICKE